MILGQTFKDTCHPEVVSLVDVFVLKLREGEGKRPPCCKDSSLGCCSQTHVVHDELGLVSSMPSALHSSLVSGDRCVFLFPVIQLNKLVSGWSQIPDALVLVSRLAERAFMGQQKLFLLTLLRRKGCGL